MSEDIAPRRPVTAALAVEAIALLQLPAVTTSAIRTWAHRGKITKYGLNWDGHMEYELVDIVRLCTARRGRPRAAAGARGLNLGEL